MPTAREYWQRLHQIRLDGGADVDVETYDLLDEIYDAGIESATLKYEVFALKPADFRTMKRGNKPKHAEDILVDTEETLSAVPPCQHDYAYEWWTNDEGKRFYGRRCKHCRRVLLLSKE